MTETFPNIIPDKASTRTYTPRILQADFGDDYSQATADGINPYEEKWSLSFTNRPKADIDAIKALLELTNGWQAFYWTPPEEVEQTPPKKWIVKDGFTFNKSADDAYTITFTAKRVHRP